MKIIFFILTVLLSNSVLAANYFISGQGGYFKLDQPDALENNVTPAGLSYGAGFGVRKEFFEIEALVLKASAKDDINHDGQKNSLVHEQTSLLLALNFYLNKAIYIRAGYGIHKINQELGTPVSAPSQQGAEAAYGMIQNKISEGILVGAGLVFFHGKSVDMYAQIEKLNYTSVNSGGWNSSLGFRFYLQ